MMAAEAQTSTTQSQQPEPNPGPSRQQGMLYGIVGGGLDEVTRRVPIDEPPPLGENSTLKSIGKPIPRLDAVQKVTGRARYTFDMQLPGMLWGRHVVSSWPHARVKPLGAAAPG
jgi:xanthine dehydrogenase YagR molybdenum-binding subunit